jgi:methylmalonyl-CoA mutase N-terminal domain/subunit
MGSGGDAPELRPAIIDVEGRLADRLAGTDSDVRRTTSGIPVERVYDAASVADLDLDERLGEPGAYPFTRGVHATMYRERPWTMRQYAGFGSAEETNARFRYLLARGQTGLSVAFDLPTQLGYDSDDPIAQGEVGRTGVAIDSLADMEVLLDGIPLGAVSTSMTINAPAALLLLLYELVAEKQGVSGAELRGTVQNDVLKEYVARGNYIFPPRPSMRLATDLFAYCAERLPAFNTISISGYHIREAGASAAQELAFTLANGIAYCEAAVAAGLTPDAFGERLSFFFNAHNHFFQEVAKFRAARRLWAGIMRDRFGATNPRALALRFHAQTGGSTLTAQQPENNIVRVAIQALSAVCGGAQSLHTNSFDEALALPTEHAATIALRTQQILAAETGTTDTADPLGGSYFLEALTDELEQRAKELIDRVDELGGAVAAIEQGFVQAEIEAAAFLHQSAVESGERIVVGVNAYTVDSSERVELLQVDPEIELQQRERTARVRSERDAGAATVALAEVGRLAATDANLLPALREALHAQCTVGEICGLLRELWGTYDNS